jgi:hypothetical protein
MMIAAIHKIIREVVIKTYLLYLESMVVKLNLEDIVLGLH